MANTFKVKTNGAMPTSGSAETLYTVPSSTTTVVIGLLLCNIHTSAVTVDVSLESDTSDTETNSSDPGVVTLTDQPMNQTEGMTRLNCNNAVVALVTSEAYQKLDEDGRNAMLDDIMKKSMILYVNTIQKPKLQK